MEEYAAFLDAIMPAVREAGSVVGEYFQKSTELQIREKEDKTMGLRGRNITCSGSRRNRYGATRRIRSVQKHFSRFFRTSTQ